MIIPFGNHVGIEIRNRIGYDQGVGAFIVGGAEVGRSDFLTGIYQIRRTKKSGRIQVLSRETTPGNPRTVKQQANRYRFREAMLEWQSFSELQKKPWNDRAKGKPQTGANLFISDYMKNNN